MIKLRNTAGNLFLYNSMLNPCQSSILSSLQKRNYIQNYMKWKKDRHLDSIQPINKSQQLKPIIAMKNRIIQADPQDFSIPISLVSKKGLPLGILHMKVATFLRKNPSFFEEFKGPKYNLPWFRLTRKAIELDREERHVYETCKADIVDRLRRVILMSTDERKVLPLRIIKGLQWDLGLPDDLLENPQIFSNGLIRFMDTADGEIGLSASSDGNNETILSALQKNAKRRGANMEEIGFSLFPAKGLRLKRKICDWLIEFQKLPYISPYDSRFSSLNRDSDMFEKRLVGMLHELLCLFVCHAARRKKILILKKFVGFPQLVHRAFERHPYMFYLSRRNGNCTVILREAYFDKSAIEPHPLAKVRKKYIGLMQESTVILSNRGKGENARDIILKTKDLDGSNNEGNLVQLLDSGW